MSLFTSRQAASAAVRLDVCPNLPDALLLIPQPGAAVPFTCPNPCPDFARCRFRDTSKPAEREAMDFVRSSEWKPMVGLLADVAVLYVQSESARCDVTDAVELQLGQANAPAGLRKLYHN